MWKSFNKNILDVRVQFVLRYYLYIFKFISFIIKLIWSTFAETLRNIDTSFKNYFNDLFRDIYVGVFFNFPFPRFS